MVGCQNPFKVVSVSQLVQDMRAIWCVLQPLTCRKCRGVEPAQTLHVGTLHGVFMSCTGSIPILSAG